MILRMQLAALGLLLRSLSCVADLSSLAGQPGPISVLSEERKALRLPGFTGKFGEKSWLCGGGRTGISQQPRFVRANGQERGHLVRESQ